MRSRKNRRKEKLMSCVTWHLLMLGRGLTAVSVCVCVHERERRSFCVFTCGVSVSLLFLHSGRCCRWESELKGGIENDVILSPVFGAMCALCSTTKCSRTQDIVVRAVLTADILTCHDGKSTGVTNNTHNGPVIFPVRVIVSQHGQYNTHHWVFHSFILHLNSTTEC